MTAALRLQSLDLLDFVIKVRNDLFFANPVTFSAAKVTLQSRHNIWGNFEEAKCALATATLMLLWCVQAGWEMSVALHRSPPPAGVSKKHVRGGELTSLWNRSERRRHRSCSPWQRSAWGSCQACWLWCPPAWEARSSGSRWRLQWGHPESHMHTCSRTTVHSLWRNKEHPGWKDTHWIHVIPRF